jgi:hypothetical protein
MQVTPRSSALAARAAGGYSIAMVRSRVSRLVLVACVAVVGCGDDADSPEREGSSPDSSRLFVSLSEAEAVIEDEGALAVVRTGGADVGGVDGEPDLDDALLADAACYAT